MDSAFYQSLTNSSLNGEPLTEEQALQILKAPHIELLPLLNAAYQVRKTTFSNKVSIHIINNAKNGNCPEDCGYCAQAKTADTDIDKYAFKEEEEILAEAKRAYESGAYRYCMVYAGRGPSKNRVKRLADTIEKIKKTYPIQVCLSPGLIDDEDAKALKAAGLDRLNHNLNTSKSYYEKICSTHTYDDRLNTLMSAHKAGIETCSGIIIGMGETAEDILEVALKLREMNTPSIPVNFFIPIDGARLAETQSAFKNLSPEYCLKVLCLFRFLNPKAEIRVAAGREVHLRGLQAMAFYPANSLFLEGYLNVKGQNAKDTLQMLKDGGFEITSTDKSLDDLLTIYEIASADANVQLKAEKDLRPVK